MTNNINISNRFGKELRSREQAHEIVLLAISSDDISVDFKDVTYVSRSFADEFYKILFTKKNIKIINQREDIAKIFESISKTHFKKKADNENINVVKLNSLNKVCLYLSAI